MRVGMGLTRDQEIDYAIERGDRDPDHEGVALFDRREPLGPLVRDRHPRGSVGHAAGRRLRVDGRGVRRPGPGRDHDRVRGRVHRTGLGLGGSDDWGFDEPGAVVLDPRWWPETSPTTGSTWLAQFWARWSPPGSNGSSGARRPGPAGPRLRGSLARTIPRPCSPPTLVPAQSRQRLQPCDLFAVRLHLVGLGANIGVWRAVQDKCRDRWRWFRRRRVRQVARRGGRARSP